MQEIPKTKFQTIPPRILLGPGPMMVPPRVLQAMVNPMIGYLDPDFISIMEEVSDLLKISLISAAVLFLLFVIASTIIATPFGPVWNVTKFWLISNSAACSAALGESTNFIPPALYSLIIFHKAYLNFAFNKAFYFFCIIF